jgi:hypothetical protein
VAQAHTQIYAAVATAPSLTAITHTYTHLRRRRRRCRRKEKQLKRKEAKAETAAQLETSIEKELLARLQVGGRSGGWLLDLARLGWGGVGWDGWMDGSIPQLLPLRCAY